MGLFARFTVLATAALLSACTSNRTAPKPNIVLILADDLGFGDPRVYNPESKIPTPNIDRLAAEGMRFTDAHSPSSVCTPTRYGILAGRYAWRTRLRRGVLGPYGAPLIEADRLTLAKMLQQQGYRTACIGKWHLGWEWILRDGRPIERDSNSNADADIDLTKPPTSGPKAAGFDYYFGTDVPNYPPYIFIENESFFGPPPVLPKPGEMYGNPGRMQAGWKLERILPTLQEKAVAYIEQQAGRGPFFLYFPLTAPHTPIVPSAAWQGTSEAGDYGDLVAEVDGVVGAVMDALERTGTAENTLLIVTSDNGSPARAGDPHLRSPDWARPGAVVRLFNHHPSNGWRGMKGDVWEGGHRVPLLVRWPGRIEPGTVNRRLACLADIMATVAAVTGYNLAPDDAPDSVNLLPLLRGGEQAGPLRAAVVHHSLTGVFCVRRDNWKLIAGLGSGGFTKPRKVDPQPGGPEGQLYDLAADPTEQHNLWLERPAVVAELTAALEAWKAAGHTRP